MAWGEGVVAPRPMAIALPAEVVAPVPRAMESAPAAICAPWPTAMLLAPLLTLDRRPMAMPSALPVATRAVVPKAMESAPAAKVLVVVL